MDKNNIEDSEVLYRAVLKSYPDSFINGKPSAALFMDPEGTSVERDGNRVEQEIMQTLENRFNRNGSLDNFDTAVKITAEECRKAETYPNPTGNKRNVYHAEIHDSANVKEIGLLKALKLALLCRIVNIT